MSSYYVISSLYWLIIVAGAVWRPDAASTDALPCRNRHLQPFIFKYTDYLYIYKPESARFGQSQPELARVSQGQSESFRVSQSLPESARVSQRQPESARVSQSQPASARVSLSKPVSARVRQRQP